MQASNEKRQAQAQALHRALKQQLSLGHKLAECFRSLSESIVSRNVDQVVALVDECGRIQAKDALAEQARRNASASLAIAVGMKTDEEPPSLSQLTRRIPPSDAATLRAVAREIRALDAELRANMEQNRTLLQNALEFIEFSLNAITSAAMQPLGYGANRAVAITPTFYLDQRA
jgi:hypothetical protein